MTEPTELSRQDAALTLGVALSADQDEVKRRYRLLARATHPDVGGDPDEFALIQQAYERLLADDAPPAPTQVRRPSRTPAAPQNLAAYLNVETIDWTGTTPDTPVETAEQLAAFLAQPATNGLLTFTARSRAPGAFTNRFAHALSGEFTSKLQVSGEPHGAKATQITVTIDAQSRKARRAVRQLKTDPRWIKQRRSSGTRLRCVFVHNGDRFGAAVHAAAQTAEILTRMGWPLTDWHATTPARAKAT